MRTTFRLFAAAAFTALGILTSCQQQGLVPFSDSNELVPVTFKASFVQTKVSYEETSAKNLQPAWEADDKVIGFDGNNNTYEFTVTDVNPTSGAATLTGTAPANCTLHLVYLCGAVKDAITSGSLSVSYDGQTGDKTMPAVMLADGEVTYGSGNFHFSNAGAIIGISAVNGVPSGATISKITVEGENLSAATVTLDGTALKLTATPKTGDAISTATLSGITVTDANGTLSTPLYIAVPAGAVIKKVSASVSAKTYSYTLAAAKTAADGEYLYVKTQEFKDPYNGHAYVEITAKYDGTNVTALKWATCNVGAASPKDYGWYFSWGGTVGYVYDGSKWVTADGGVELSGGFNWANAPFNNGSSSYNATYFSSVRNTVCPDNVLAPDYDAASVNWGGTWRMPTSAEFKAMYDATKWTWDSTDKGYYVTKKDEALSADKSNALLFFPAAGVGYNASLLAGSRGRYWSSSLDSSNPNDAYDLDFGSDDVGPRSSSLRCYGQSVRPLSD